jgi:hypothetical protein
MPYGVYEAGVAGDEVSSTYEGRHLTFSESQLTHPDNGDGFVNKGDPVLVGNNIVGVAFLSAAAATDLIPIDTEGIWQLSVVATDEDGSSAVAVGDEIFINRSTCILSKNKDKGTHQRFGYALYAITGGDTDVIPVKVHFDPDDEIELVGYSTNFVSIGTANNAREYRYRSTATSGDIRGMYMALALNGVGSAGEAVRARTIVEAVGVAGGVHGLHGGVEHDTDGTLTGLGVGVRGTYMCPNRAAGGTICGGMSELWAEGDASDFGGATVHSIHRFVMDGDSTGYATGDNVFEFVNLSATQYAGNTDTPDHALRCIINGNVRYIMVSEAQS